MKQFLDDQMLLSTTCSSDRRSGLLDIPQLKQIWRSLVQWLFAPELTIIQTIDHLHHICWIVRDPSTNQRMYFVSEDELRIWLDRRYYNF